MKHLRIIQNTSKNFFASLNTVKSLEIIWRENENKKYLMPFFKLFFNYKQRLRID